MDMGPTAAPSALQLLALPHEVLSHNVWPHLGPASRAALRAACKELRAWVDAKLPTSLSFDVSGEGLTGATPGQQQQQQQQGQLDSALSLLRRAQGSVREVCLCLSKWKALSADDLARVVGAVAEAAQHKLTSLSLHFAHTSFTWGPEVIRAISTLTDLQQLRVSAYAPVLDYRTWYGGPQKELLLSGSQEEWEQVYALLPPSLHSLRYDLAIERAELLLQGSHVAGLAHLRSLRRLHLCIRSKTEQIVDVAPLAQALLALQGGAAAQEQGQGQGPWAGPSSKASSSAAATAAAACGSERPVGCLQELGVVLGVLPDSITGSQALVEAVVTVGKSGGLTHLCWFAHPELPLATLLPPVSSTLQQLEVHVPWVPGPGPAPPDSDLETICILKELRQLTFSGMGSSSWAVALGNALNGGPPPSRPLPKLACLRLHKTDLNSARLNALAAALPQVHLVLADSGYKHLHMNDGPHVREGKMWSDILGALARHPGGWSYETAEVSQLTAAAGGALSGPATRPDPLLCERVVELGAAHMSMGGPRWRALVTAKAEEASRKLATVVPFLHGLVLASNMPDRFWAADALGKGSSLRVLGLKGLSSHWSLRLCKLSALRAAGYLPGLRELWLMQGGDDGSCFREQPYGECWGPKLAGLLNQGRACAGGADCSATTGYAAYTSGGQGEGASSSGTGTAAASETMPRALAEASGVQEQGASSSSVVAHIPPIVARLVPQQAKPSDAARAMLAFIRPMLFDKDSLLLGAWGLEEEGVEVRRQRAVAASVQAAKGAATCPALAAAYEGFMISEARAAAAAAAAAAAQAEVAALAAPDAADQ